MSWHFDKLNEEDRQNVRVFYEKQQFSEIKRIFDARGVIPVDMCSTCGLMKKTIEWTKWAINEGKI